MGSKLASPLPTGYAQPDLPEYPISDLYLFPVYTNRAAYLAATGKQAPAFNPAWPIKEWFDPSPSGNPYLVFSASTPPSYTTEAPMPAVAAGAVNLPGAYTFPSFVPAQTDATLAPYGTPISAIELCTLAQAQAFSAVIAQYFPGQDVTPTEFAWYPPYGIVYPKDEDRRQYVIPALGLAAFVGNYLAAQSEVNTVNGGGVGSPGVWQYGVVSTDTAAGKQLYWEPTAVPSVASANAVTMSVPIRTPFLNEQITNIEPPNPLGVQTWVVVRTDLQQSYAVVLAQVQALLVKLNAIPGGQPMQIIPESALLSA
jgi:hypothetical protein